MANSGRLTEYAVTEIYTRQSFSLVFGWGEQLFIVMELTGAST